MNRRSFLKCVVATAAVAAGPSLAMFPVVEVGDDCDGMVAIHIDMNAEGNGVTDKFLYVGINCTVYWLPKGRDVLVPPSVECALRNSKSYPYRVIAGHRNIINDSASGVVS